jgi:hypothetical protein
MGITLGHVTSTLFMTNKYVTDAGLQQWVVCGKNAATGETKHGLNVFHFKRTDERFSSSEYLFG